MGIFTQSVWKSCAVLMLITIVLVAGWGVLDYRAFTSLGEGGIPHTVKGWITANKLRYLARGTDPLNTSKFEALIGVGSDLYSLREIKKREGSRPEIGSFPVPHRQLDQLNGQNVRDRTGVMLDNLVSENKERITYKVSQYERNNGALWLINPELGNQSTKNGGEIAHLHPADGSLHLILSPSDSKAVIDAGRGELHRLAGTPGLPATTYMLIYAPRTDSEIELIRKIVESAIVYAAQSIK